MTVKVADVSHHYGLRPVLSHISLDITDSQSGRCHGTERCGKKHPAEYYRRHSRARQGFPSRSTASAAGLRDPETELKIRKQMAYLPDHPWLPEFMTAREWLLAVGGLYDIDSERLMDHISRLLQLFQLSDKGESPIRTCSNGQKKKVAIFVELW